MDFGNVLVPIDGSYLSEVATHLAVDSAAAYGSKLVFVYVMDESQISSFGNVDSHKQRFLLEQEGRLALEHAISASKIAGILHEAIIIEGVPDIIIPEIAKEMNIIIMGITGKSGYGKGRIGGTAESTILSAPCPVLTLKSGSSHVDSIMLPVAYSTEAALDAAISTVKQVGCKLTLFMVKGDEEGCKDLDEVKVKCSEAGVPVSVQEGKGDVIDAIITHSGMFDMVIMGKDTAHGRRKSFVKSALGEVIAQASCPVLVV